MRYISLEMDRLMGIKNDLESSLSRINDIIALQEIRDNMPFDQMSKDDKKEYVLNGMAKFFGIHKDKLFSSSRHKSITIRKKYAAKLLTKYVGYNQDDIFELLGYTNRSSVSNAIDKLEEWLSPMPFGADEIKEEWDNLLLHLKFRKL
jgi:chromosomal replication initiation ATPase DnaA